MATSAVHSNAFNFLSAVQSSIDARTGQCKVNISLPELKCNFLNGPIFSPTLSFSALNTENSGFGLGWDLKLSQYDPGTQVLSLSSGETFKVTNMVGSRLEMQEQKIRSFFFYEDAPGLYRVVHKSGIIEMLRTEGRLALPETLYSPEGHKVSVAYSYFGSGQRRLHTVTDGQGVVLLQVDYPVPGRDAIEILLRPDGNPGGALAKCVLKLRNSGPGDELYEVVLPTEDQASWRFNYRTVSNLHCITDIKSPSGSHDTIEYAGNGHTFPGNTRQPIPRVWKHISDPGFGQDVLEVRYSYDNSNLPGSSHNFLGNNASNSWADDGLDNLYKVIDRYRYGTTETHYVDGLAVRSIERTFNRFHLLTEEKTTQGNKVHQVFTTYYADDDLDLPFSRQSPQCQLAKTVETRWSEKGNSRSEKVLTAYDTHGNLTEQVQANGIKESYSYFPVTGIPGECPADPSGFVRSQREKTVTPAPGHEAGAPVLRTRNRYALMPPVKGTAQDASGDWLVLTDETLYQVDGAQEQQLKHSAYKTFNAPADALRHGRRTQQAITLHSLDDTFINAVTTTDYAYEVLNSTFVGETVLQTIETLTGYDHGKDGKHTQKTITREDSLLHGQPLLTHNDSDLRIRYKYDALQRVVSETVAPGDPLYEAERTYSYFLSNADGLQAWQVATDVKGVKTKTLFDGFNRVVQEQRQDKDNRTGARAEEFRCTYVTHYNALGKLEEETEYDWCSAEPEDDLVLTSRYTFDDWGEQCSVMRPDGVVAYEFTDPVAQTTTTWVEGLGKTVTHNNLFEKSDWVKRYALGDDPTAPGVEPLSEHHHSYDGLGRSTQEIDALSRTTEFVYDAYDRMIKRTLPDNTIVERQYARHSSAELPITVRVIPVDAQLKPVLAGAQAFDGLERLRQLTVGPRIEQYEYAGSQFQVSKRITPAGQSIDYFYAPGLTEQPIRIETPEDKLSKFDYDPKTAYLRSSINNLGKHEFDYDNSGHLKAHHWTVDSHVWSTTYRQSSKGRQLVRNDVEGIDCQYVYETHTGRLESLHQGYIKVEFEYDTMGRLLRTICQDLQAKTTLTTELAYDDLGREVLRTLRPSDQPARVLHQTWYADDRLQSRHLKTEDDRSVLLEEFSYDQRGRLELYLCSGDQLPKDRHGNEMTEQLFVFDALDNITLCRTRFKDGSQDYTEFAYDREDACQLKSLTHTHASYVPQHVEFEYNANGNLLNDEQGRRLSYDSQGRLIAVSEPNGSVVTDYRYDPHNHLFGVKHVGQSETLRFYQNEQLSDTVQDQTHVQYLYGQGQPLGQQQVGNASQTLLLMTDGKKSVIGETQQSTLRTDPYSAYGERDSKSTMKSRLGFNREVCEEITQWYLLGRGYRAYDIGLMRFHSPDSLSPFGAGGMNPYMYCAGDPINFSDPTGHFISFGDGGIDMIVFGLIEIAVGVVTMNPVPVLTGTTQVVAGAGMKSENRTDSQKETDARIGNYAGLVGLFSSLGKSGFKTLIKKPKPPKPRAPFLSNTMDKLSRPSPRIPRPKVSPHSEDLLKPFKGIPRANAAPFSQKTLNALQQPFDGISRATEPPFSLDVMTRIEQSPQPFPNPSMGIDDPTVSNWILKTPEVPQATSWSNGIALPWPDLDPSTIRGI